MNALEELKKRAEEEKQAGEAKLEKTKQNEESEDKFEIIKAEIKRKEEIIKNFSPSSTEEYIKNKEQFFNIIDMIADVGILEVEKKVWNCKDKELKELILKEDFEEINKLKEETKIKIMQEFEYLTDGIPSTTNRKSTARVKIQHWKFDMERKLIDIEYKSKRKAKREMPTKTVVIFFLLAIAVAVIGIALHSLILTTVGELICMVLFTIQYYRYPGDVDMFAKATIFLFILSIILGIAFKSFFVGLFGCIASVLYGFLLSRIYRSRDTFFI